MQLNFIIGTKSKLFNVRMVFSIKLKQDCNDLFWLMNTCM